MKELIRKLGKTLHSDMDMLNKTLEEQNRLLRKILLRGQYRH